MKSLKNKKFLVLGGTGFLGKVVLSSLLESNAKVLLVSRDFNKIKEIESLFSKDNLQTFQGNIFDKNFLTSLLNNVDGIINLCGILFESKKDDFYRVHSELPTLLAELCVNKNIMHLIHLSALGVSETSQSNYSKSKAEGERKLLSKFPSGKIIRPSIIYGDGDNFFGQFSKMASISPFLPLISGKTRFQPIFVKDVVKAIITILTNKNNNNIFELGGEKIYSFEELLNILFKARAIKRLLIPLNPKLMMIPAFFLQNLPNPPFTIDQMRLLMNDNIIQDKLPGLNDLGIKATDLIGEVTRIYGK
tara:strand:+ start:946 stop:1860 length:915 start_codon:yes stop_codon:yes gene_type:complete